MQSLISLYGLELHKRTVESQTLRRPKEKFNLLKVNTQTAFELVKDSTKGIV